MISLYEQNNLTAFENCPPLSEIEFAQISNGHRAYIVQECSTNGFWHVLSIYANEDNIKIIKPDGAPGYPDAKYAHKIAMMYKAVSDDYSIVRPLGIDPVHPEDWELGDQFKDVDD